MTEAYHDYFCRESDENACVREGKRYGEIVPLPDFQATVKENPVAEYVERMGIKLTLDTVREDFGEKVKYLHEDPEGFTNENVANTFGSLMEGKKNFFNKHVGKHIDREKFPEVKNAEEKADSAYGIMWGMDGKAFEGLNVTEDDKLVINENGGLVYHKTESLAALDHVEGTTLILMDCRNIKEIPSDILEKSAASGGTILGIDGEKDLTAQYRETGAVDITAAAEETDRKPKSVFRCVDLTEHTLPKGALGLRRALGDLEGIREEAEKTAIEVRSKNPKLSLDDLKVFYLRNLMENELEELENSGRYKPERMDKLWEQTEEYLSEYEDYLENQAVQKSYDMDELLADGQNMAYELYKAAHGEIPYSECLKESMDKMLEETKEQFSPEENENLTEQMESIVKDEIKKEKGGIDHAE